MLYQIQCETVAEIKIKKSVFITHLNRFKESKSVKEYISHISKENKTANHNCWAYIIGDEGEMYHSSDQGEPSGTAGKPILGVLQKHNLTNVVAVVTRYFGGIKLGIRGLIDAYSQAVETAVQKAEIKPFIKFWKTNIVTDYSHFEKIKHTLRQIDANIENEKYSDKVEFDALIDEHELNEMKSILDELQENKIIDWVEIGIMES